MQSSFFLLLDESEKNRRYSGQVGEAKAREKISDCWQ
jgi:hypothetical protein